MRTPDSDDSSGEAGSLADGFGDDDLDDDPDTYDTSGLDSSPYGDGWSPDSYGDSVGDSYGDNDTTVSVDDVDTGLDGSDPASPFDMDPGDVATDTDLDMTGDGVVDAADFHEAVTAIFDFGVDHHESALHTTTTGTTASACSRPDRPAGARDTGDAASQRGGAARPGGRHMAPVRDPTR